MGIRYGRIPHGSGEVEWHHISHVECDGIGGFARLLRQRGAVLDQLPITKIPCRSVIRPIWILWRKSLQATRCARRSDWLDGQTTRTGPPEDVAWHVFSETETQDLLAACRIHRVTLNSLLLHHLDAAVRPELGLAEARLPWLIPVNLRTEVRLPDDTVNQVSGIDVVIGPADNMHQVHQQILHRLAHGEHRANFLLMELGKLLSHEKKMRMLARSRAMPAGNIGSFSNLGSWDTHQEIDSRDSWLFCPPLVTGQRLAAGCVTFQNRLSLMMQAHANHTGLPELTKVWMQRWIKRIEKI
jgi:hypothetical protein